MKKRIAFFVALALMAALGCTASADTIRARPLSIDMNRLENLMVRTDIEYREGDIMVMTLYERERFDAEAVRAAKAGDVIVTAGEEITVETVEEDGPDLIFNKGTETEMLFCDAGDDVFEHVTENGDAPWLTVGTMEQAILEYYPILDTIDPMTGEDLDDYVVYRGDRLKELLQNPEAVGFNHRNVDVVYDRANQPVLMLRYGFPDP